MEEGFRATADLIALDWLPGFQPRYSRGDGTRISPICYLFSTVTFSFGTEIEMIFGREKCMLKLLFFFTVTRLN